jgi:hypothetical protein
MTHSMKPHDKLAKALDLIPMGPGEFKAPTTQNPDNQDYEYARQNLYGLIEKGNQALEDLFELARQSQHTKAFEVLSTMIGTLTKSNKDLLELQKWKGEIEKTKKQSDEIREPGAKITNVFVGTTADLQRMIEETRKKNNG